MMNERPKAAVRDLEFMQRALALARQKLGTVWPNPSVGCVVVQDDKVIAEAVTQDGGRPHAETEALRAAGKRAEGATVYVTLEPCSHTGETPPCAEALIKAKVQRVVVALKDEDKRVNGRGIDMLLEAGISVELGICENEARQINSGFFHLVRTGRPLLTRIEPDLRTASGYLSDFSHYDAVFVALEDWQPKKIEGVRFWFVLDSPNLAPADIVYYNDLIDDKVCFIMPEGRSPSRVTMIEPYFPQILMVPSGDDQFIDYIALWQMFGDMGLTHVAVDGRVAPREAFEFAR